MVALRMIPITCGWEVAINDEKQRAPAEFIYKEKDLSKQIS